MVSLNLCKEYLNVVTFKIPVFTPDVELNILIYRRFFCVITYRSYKLLQLVQFFGLPCTRKVLIERDRQSASPINSSATYGCGCLYRFHGLRPTVS